MSDAYDPAAYGAVWSGVYDTMLGAMDPSAAEAAAERVAEVAGDGAVLEFGVGTGRLALPIAARGVAVTGLDASAEMVKRLRTKPGGLTMPIVVGDMISERVEGEFAVVLIAFNTLFALPEQHLQVACMRNAARHLAPGGAVMVEAFVPAAERTPPNHVAGARYRAPDHVSFTLTNHDPVRQTVESAWVRITSGTTEVLPNLIRYAWPAELDLMAELAGLQRTDRWAGWRGEPFSADSTNGVSLYRRPVA